MNCNDFLRRLRYSLDLSNKTMIEIFRLAGRELDLAALLDLLKKEDEAGYRECGIQELEGFLDGLITLKRGPREQPAAAAPSPGEFSNNVILRKLRIALELKEDQMIAIMGRAGVRISRPELSALFRTRGHKNYKPCGDQFLRNFLTGLAHETRAGAGKRPTTHPQTEPS